MLNNYTIHDIFSSSLAFILFSLIYVFPGYTTAWLFDLFDFRKRLQSVRFVIAIAVSIAVSPIFAFLTWNLVSVRFTFAALGVFAIGFGVILMKSRTVPVSGRIKHFQWLAILAAASWTAFTIASLVDIQIGDKLYFNIVSHDFTTRVAIINAMTRTGVPPVNPSYFPGHPVRLTYLYYFWYIPCSLIDQIGGVWVDAHAAMIASVAWCGLALMSIVALYLRTRNPEGGTKAWKSGLLGNALLLVSGLDIIPILFWLANPKTVSNFASLQGDLEQWNEQITAWLGALSWVPHHVAALIACLVGIMLLQTIRRKSTFQQLKITVVIGLAFASAIGLSVFVTLVFVFFWGIWLTVFFFQKERKLGLLMVLAGMIALIAASPFLLGLITPGYSSTGHDLPIALSVRVFRPIIPLVITYPPALLNLVFLLLLPINYLVELGFFFITGLLWIQQHNKRQLQQNPFYISETILLLVTLLIGSFVRSTTIETNDFGWRAWLPGQFVLLIWSVDVVNALIPNGWRNIASISNQTQKLIRQLAILLAIGLLTTIANIVLLRTWPLMVDAGIANFPNGLSPDTQLGKRTLAARQAYDYVNEKTPEATIIESNPIGILDIPIGLYANRQIAASAHTAFGVSAEEFESRISRIATIFNGTNWDTMDQTCKENSINLLIANDLDPLWKNLPVLEQQRQPLYQNQYYAIFPCGNPVNP